VTCSTARFDGDAVEAVDLDTATCERCHLAVLQDEDVSREVEEGGDI